jgi:hypothetical protein
MDNHGYMGTKFVRIDRCAHCRLVWMDTNEFGVMCQVYGRSQEGLRALEKWAKWRKGPSGDPAEEFDGTIPSIGVPSLKDLGPLVVEMFRQMFVQKPPPPPCNSRPGGTS